MSEANDDRRTSRTLRRTALSALAAATLCTLAAGQVGSAAKLQVKAAPIQFWDMEVHVDLPELPADLSDCGPLDQYDEIVTGTAGPDRLVAGNGRQILVGLGGDDHLEAGNHDDCLVGGAGDDTLLGGNGKDILVGGAGADVLDGGNGPDVVHGDGADTCMESGHPDVISGCPAPTAPELLDEPGSAVPDAGPTEPADNRQPPGRSTERSPEARQGGTGSDAADQPAPRPVDPPAAEESGAAPDVAQDVVTEQPTDSQPGTTE